MWWNIRFYRILPCTVSEYMYSHVLCSHVFFSGFDKPVEAQHADTLFWYYCLNGHEIILLMPLQLLLLRQLSSVLFYLKSLLILLSSCRRKVLYSLLVGWGFSCNTPEIYTIGAHCLFTGLIESESWMPSSFHLKHPKGDSLSAVPQGLRDDLGTGKAVANTSDESWFMWHPPFPFSLAPLHHCSTCWPDQTKIRILSWHVAGVFSTLLCCLIFILAVEQELAGRLELK